MKKKQKKVTVASLAAQAPRGWTATIGEGSYCFGEVWPRDKHGVRADESYVNFEKTVGDLRVTVSFRDPRPVDRNSRWEKEHSYAGFNVEGDTYYNGRCFTRRGIDCSSCALRDKPDYDHEYADMPALLSGEWKRCEATFARTKTMVSVPGLPGDWSVTPERRAQIAADLKAGKAATFTPHGFGTGYRVTTGRKARSWSRALPVATADFFGVDDRLYYETLDCD